MLTPDELALVLSTEQLRPRVYSLRPNQVLFLSGLARLDCLEVGLHVVRLYSIDQFSSKILLSDFPDIDVR